MTRQSFYVGVKTIIERDGKVLLLKDAPRGKWEVPGGRVDQGQTQEQAAARELSEEIPGAQLVSLGDPIHIAIGDFTVENNHKLLLVFYASEVKLPAKIGLSNEHTDLAWVGPAEVDDYDMFSTDQAAVKAYFTLKRVEL